MKNKFFTKVITLIVLVGLGGSAGAVGAAIAINAANTAELVIAGSQTVPLSRPAVGTNYDAVSAAARDTVIFYRSRAGTGLDGVFLPAEAVGAGVVLTSDGWILTAASVLSQNVALVAVFPSGLSVPVPLGKGIKDDATGLTFVRLEADRLEVAALGDDASLLEGETVYVTAAAGMDAVSVKAVRQIPAAARLDLIESTEKFSRRLVLGQDDLLLGAPIIDRAGKIVAVSTGVSQAVPTPYFSEAMKGVFTEKKIIRPVLGVHYLSLAGLAAPPTANLSAEGSLVTGGGKIKSVVAGSPAETAGLREGDVIIAVERDRISKDAPLSEIISEYSPGAKIELTVSRAGKEIKLNATLK